MADADLEQAKAIRSETEWHSEMNSYMRKVVFDFQQLQGTREKRIEMLIDAFTQYAEESLLPQMQTLVGHIKESKGRISIGESIKRGDEYLRALRESVQRK